MTKLRARRGVAGVPLCGQGGCRYTRGACPLHSAYTIVGHADESLLAPYTMRIHGDPMTCGDCGRHVHAPTCSIYGVPQRAEPIAPAPVVTDEPAVAAWKQVNPTLDSFLGKYSADEIWTHATGAHVFLGYCSRKWSAIHAGKDERVSDGYGAHLFDTREQAMAGALGTDGGGAR